MAVCRQSLRVYVEGGKIVVLYVTISFVYWPDNLSRRVGRVGSLKVWMIFKYARVLMRAYD